MKYNFKSSFNSFFKRDLIHKNEGKLTYVQLGGFILITMGIIYLASFLLPSDFVEKVNPLKMDDAPTNYGVSIAFFTTMMGTAFAFPGMLQGQTKEISTMRIVVFMFANVICFLLLKIGWKKKSLEEIGLDQYWVGVIAFLFGAKAVQSYFESKLASPDKISKEGMSTVNFTGADIARLAIAQNEQYLKAKFPNILSISDAVHNLEDEESHKIALYLIDDNDKDIPAKLEVKMPDDTVKLISTEIIKGVGKGKINFNQTNSIQTHACGKDVFGSFCCVAKTPDSELVLVTSGHIYSGGYSNIGNGWLSGLQKDVKISDNIIGKWMFAQITQNQDMALVKLNNIDENAHQNLKKFGENSFYDITDKSVKSQEVTLISSVTKSPRQGFILDYNTSWEVPYNDYTPIKTGIILIGSVNNRNDSISVSEEGDSGGCVYHTESKKLVGIILGGNKKYTWVLPLKETFEYWDLKLI